MNSSASLCYWCNTSSAASTSPTLLTKSPAGWNKRTPAQTQGLWTIHHGGSVSTAPGESCSLEPGPLAEEPREHIQCCGWMGALSCSQQFCCTSDTYWYVSIFPALVWNSKLVKNTFCSCCLVLSLSCSRTKNAKTPKTLCQNPWVEHINLQIVTVCILLSCHKEIALEITLHDSLESAALHSYMCNTNIFMCTIHGNQQQCLFRGA